MEFSSLAFLLYFLPVFFLIYLITPKSLKNVTLIAGSYLFYLQGEWKYALLLPVSMVANFLLGKCLDPRGKAVEETKKKRKDVIYLLAVIANLAVLCHFKLWTTGLPLGLSFYTFQVLSYLIDVHAGEIPAEQSLIRFVNYLGMFPKLVSGPITPYASLREALRDRRIDAERFTEGIKVFILGLSLKTLLADRISILWAEVGKTGYESVTWRYAWLGAIGYSLMLYFNFYGYSLMAVGLGKMTGFELPENFHLPYLARSVRDFYRRWHITMGLWFRKYVYFHLGGNRLGEGRTILNLLAVWLLTGFWHGVSANFFLWGVFLWLCIVLERLFDRMRFVKKLKVLPHLWLWFVIPISWMLFAITDIHELQAYLLRMFGVGDPINGNPTDYLICLKRHLIVLLAGMTCCTGVVEAVFEKWKKRLWMSVLLAGLFWLCVWKILAAGSNPFLYLNF